MDMADEVYYITPYLWNGRVKKFIRKNDTKIRKIDLTATNGFSIGSTICYWNNHKSDKVTIYSKNKQVVVDKLSDIEYLPYDLENTLSIHQKGWMKKDRLLRINGRLHTNTNKHKILESDDEHKYKVYHQHINKIYYAKNSDIEKYGLDDFQSPKIIIGMSSDNRPFFDRVGEYATTQCSYFVTDTIENLEMRYEQMNSNFAKFWFTTGRQDLGDDKMNGLFYHAAFRLYPNIPLSIMSDDAIYRYFDLTDKEIEIIEKYAKIVDNENEKRVLRYAKKAR